MKYYIALFQKIKDYYKTQSSNPNEIALICPSLRIYDDSEMKLLLPQVLIKEELKLEALLKKKDLSFQLNSLPSSDKYWDINIDNTLFDVYDQIINTKQEVNIQADDIENKEAEKVLFDSSGKPTKEKKAYDKYFALFEKLLAEWENHVAKYPDLQTDDEKQVWLEKLNVILLKKEKAIIDHKLLGYKKLIEDAWNKINKTDGFDIFLSSLSNSRNILETSKKTDIQSLQPYLDINFVPYDFMSSDNGWVKLSMNKKELDELYETAKLQQSDFPKEIISIDYDEKNIIGIELEFSIVSMQRNWFSTSSIVSSFFKWNEAKSISDGETISNDFLLSAYPKKMPLIKNLKINIDQVIDPNVVSNINQLIHFGPIIMKNQLFVNSNNNIKFIKAIRNKETLSSNNIKYYNTKAEISKPVAVSAAITPKPVVTAPVATTMMMHGIKPMTTTVQPTTIIKPLTIKPLTINPILFNPVTILQPTINLATIIINVKDIISKLPVYKSEISVIGINNTVFKEIESDKDGLISFQLPIGNYNIEIRKDGYAIFKTPLNITNTNPVSKEFFLDPESVTYDSFFLIGMICEKLPKIPQ